MLKKFDWDNYFASASFKEILSRSPELSSRRYPTAFSPDRSLVYLSSQDDAVETDNQDQLKSFLADVKDAYNTIVDAPQIDHGKAYIARTDFITICGLLANCSGDPDEYADPDFLLHSICDAK